MNPIPSNDRTTFGVDAVCDGLTPKGEVGHE